MTKETAMRAEILPYLGEVFRRHGYEGASIAVLCKHTGLGRGSLYHFFPGGKEDMASAVLSEIREWFEDQVFSPLGEQAPEIAIRGMCKSTEQYFHSGARVCLVGIFALDETRDLFAETVAEYFDRWVDALAGALRRGRVRTSTARALAEDSVIRIQGALVLARARDEPACFPRSLRRVRKDLLTALKTSQ